MNNFEYYNPVRVLFGAGELKRIGEEAKNWVRTSVWYLTKN